MSVEKIREKSEKVLVNNHFYLTLSDGMYYENNGENYSIIAYNYKPENNSENLLKGCVDLKVIFLRPFPDGRGPKDVDITDFINNFYKKNDENYKKENVEKTISMVGKYKGLVKILKDTDEIKVGYCSNKSIIGDIPLINEQLVETLQGYIITNKGIYMVHSHYNYLYGMPDELESFMDEVLTSASTNVKEEQKKNEDNKNRMQELKEQWEKECEYIEEKRKVDLKEYIEDTRKKYDNIIVEMQRNIDAEIDNLEVDKKITEDFLKTQEEKFAKIGIFSFSKKAEWKENIENSKKRLAEFNEKIEQKEKDKKTSKQELEKEYEKTVSDYEKELSNKYQLPSKPKDLQDYINSLLTPTEKENNRLKKVIIDAILYLNKPVTKTDLQKYSDELAEISDQKLSALLMQLVHENELGRIVDKHTSYFYKN